jgi:D-alanyl-D-alanine carboxypeptidase/D-alanyl-D-alanine-endopeptidase (penicillin-binding protein 4)
MLKAMNVRRILRYAMASLCGGCACIGLYAQQAPSVPERVTAPSQAASALAIKLDALLADPAVAHAHWGIAVTTLDGAPLYAHDAAKFFRPASNNKLFTSAAAMAVLGAQTTFTTKVYGKLNAATGTVDGDLMLVGAGDANLDSGDLPYIAPALRPKNASPAAPELPGLASLHDLESLADQIVAHGVKHIAGSVLGDDRRFAYEPYPQAWELDDLVWGYGAPVSAITIHDNELKLTITPGEITGPKGRETFHLGVVTLEQFGVPYYTVLNEVQTRPAGTPGASLGVDVQRNPGSRVLRVYGAMAVDAPTDVEEVAIDDPAEFAAMALEQMLVARGVVVDGAKKAAEDMLMARGLSAQSAALAVPMMLERRHVTNDGVAAAVHQPSMNGASFLAQLLAPDGCITMKFEGGACGGNHLSIAYFDTLLATHTSAPLGDDVTYTLKVSQNLHAELLLHHLGEAVMSGYGSTLDGAKMIRGFAIHAGVDPGDFVLYDGSGLSSHDLVTPRSLVTLLQYAAQQPWFAQWKAALPDAGEDGTLRSRFGTHKDASGAEVVSPLKDKLWAKTGTLGESRALSGYLVAASGQTLIFSVLCDDHSPAASADRRVMDEVVEAIAAAE